MICTFTQIRSLRRVLVPMTVLLAAACTKDPMTDGPAASGPAVRFAVTQSDGWNTTVKSRAAGEDADAAADGPRFAGVLTLRGDTPADTLFLHAAVEDGIEGTRPGGQEGVTRAAPIVDKAGFHDSFGVFAYIAPANETYTNKSLYMNNVKVSKPNWGTDYRWPGSSNQIRFFAYAPHNAQGITLNDAKTGIPGFHYEVPGTATAQKDLMVAASDVLAGDRNDAAPMIFAHALTAVKFVAANDLPKEQLTITEIALVGIKNEGDLTADASGTWAWSNLAGTATFSQEPNFTVAAGGTSQPIIDGENTFMMLPQTFGSGARIVVTYTVPSVGTTQTLQTSLAGQVWSEGTTVTYTISSQDVLIDRKFEVTIENGGVYPYTGGSRNVTVNSYAYVSGTNIKPGGQVKKDLPWRATFLDDEGHEISKPAWITSTTWSGTGELTFAAILARQTDSTEAYPHDDRLRDQTARPVIGRKTTSSESCFDRVDLSTSYPGVSGTSGIAGDISTHRETANCYIVNRAGYYRFPAVCGNGIVGTVANTKAYRPNTLFKNHRNAAITNPYFQLGLVPGTTLDPTRFDAEVIWQSAGNLVTGLFYTENPDCTVCFDIEPDNIHQGNALIGLYFYPNGKGTTPKELVWTWHIWVTDYLDLPDNPSAPTDYNPYEPVSDINIVNAGGQNFTVMSVNLGWVNGKITTFPERSAKVRFEQLSEDRTTVLEALRDTIVQRKQSIEREGYNPFYQWGRQVPLQGVRYDAGGYIDAPVYGTSLTKQAANGIALATYNASTGEVGGVMQNPTVFYYGAKWTSSLGVRYWNAASTQTGTALPDSVQKSIYDPCPRGYRVSDVDTYTGMTVGGANYNEDNFDLTQINTPYLNQQDIDALSGWLFYADSSKTTVFPMRFTGNRQDNSGDSQGYGTAANYWTNRMNTPATANTPTAFSAVIRYEAVMPYSNMGNANNVSFGLSVRCIRDNTGRELDKPTPVTLVPLWKGGGELIDN